MHTGVEAGARSRKYLLQAHRRVAWVHKGVVVADLIHRYGAVEAIGMLTGLGSKHHLPQQQVQTCTRCLLVAHERLGIAGHGLAAELRYLRCLRPLQGVDLRPVSKSGRGKVGRSACCEAGAGSGCCWHAPLSVISGCGGRAAGPGVGKAQGGGPECNNPTCTKAKCRCRADCRCVLHGIY